MPIDPVDSALDAVATYFAGIAGVAAARRGWPEHPTDLDLSAGPAVTVTRIGDRRTEVSPGLVSASPPWLWRVAELRITAQLDLWAAYRAQRDVAGVVVEDALHNDLPFRHGLYLFTADYHGRPLTITASDGRSIDEAKGVVEGEWRRMWMLEVVTDLVQATDTPSQSTVTLRTTADDETEPDFDVT